jgi:hypothetical protein
MRVAKSATTAARDQQFLVGLGDVSERLKGFIVDYRSANGDPNPPILPLGAGLITPTARLTVFCPIQRLVAKIDQGVEGGIGDQHHIAAVPAVSTVGSTPSNILLAAKAQAAAAAFARLNPDRGLIYKLHGN